jgi:sugar phosphate isomerase/epimerase
MELVMLRSLWSAPADLDVLFAETRAAGFDGLEGPIPEAREDRIEFGRRLADAGFRFVAEATTGIDPGGADDWWVPSPKASVRRHLDDLARTIEAAPALGALFVTTMCGYDAWSLEQSLDFFGRALELEAQSGVAIAFETHRTRSLFNPWITREILRQLPAMKLTCDFSHWVVVCERLIDAEEDVLALCAERALHVQCRVGHPQGAQVADPRDPAHARALAAHERWWDLVWDAQERRGFACTTMTPEFGAEGYLQTLPFTGQPVADLFDVIRWMARRERERFAARAKQTLEGGVERSVLAKVVERSR